MASGELLRQLINTGVRGNTAGFRAASEAVIREERQKKHHLLANDLERLLYGEYSTSETCARRTTTFSELPKNKDNDLALLEERSVIREEKDIILSDVAQSALNEIIMERNCADVLRSYGLQAG